MYCSCIIGLRSQLSRSALNHPWFLCPDKDESCSVLRIAVFYVFLSDGASANARLVAQMCNVWIGKVVFVNHILCQVLVAHTL